MRSWDLVLFEKPVSLNKERKMHYHTRASFVKVWLEGFMKLAEDAALPKGLGSVGFEVLPFTGTRRMQDPGNCYPSAKAAIDGLVEYGLIEDDDGQWVKWITFHAPVYEKGVDALWLKVVELS